MTDPTDDPDNAPRLMTTIDGEPARLLVHIEVLDSAGADATEPSQSDEGTPPDAPRLAE